MEGIIKAAGVITIIAGLFSGIVGGYLFIFSIAENRPNPVALIGFLFLLFGIAAIFYVIKTFKHVNKSGNKQEKYDDILDDDRF